MNKNVFVLVSLIVLVVTVLGCTSKSDTDTNPPFNESDIVNYFQEKKGLTIHPFSTSYGPNPYNSSDEENTWVWIKFRSNQGNQEWNGIGHIMVRDGIQILILKEFHDMLDSMELALQLVKYQ